MSHLLSPKITVELSWPEILFFPTLFRIDFSNKGFVRSQRIQHGISSYSIYYLIARPRTMGRPLSSFRRTKFPFCFSECAASLHFFVFSKNVLTPLTIPRSPILRRCALCLYTKKVFTPLTIPYQRKTACYLRTGLIYHIQY